VGADIRQDISKVIEDTLGGMLDCSIEELTSFSDSDLNKLETGAIVHILGDFLGSVSVRSSSRLARFLAGKMFGIEETDVTMDSIEDALRELVNIIGGNMKCVLGEKCIL